jgi:hypothetical protein
MTFPPGICQRVNKASVFFDLLAPDSEKMLKRPVIGLLCLFWEQTARKLSILPMIVEAITTVTLSWTALIATTASLCVPFHITCLSGHHDRKAIAATS